MSVGRTVIKQLYGFSYNECAEPDCSQTLIEVDALTGRAANYAKIAHIHGRKPGAERFLQEVYDDKTTLHGFANLILLCGRHHDQIDQPGAEGGGYTADLIRDWKASHMVRVAADLDREWVFGGRSLNFHHDGELVTLSYWVSKAGRLRFHSEDQLRQTDAARDLSVLLSQLGGLLGTFEEITGEPADASNQTANDGYLRVLKRQAEELKKRWAGSGPKGGYESALHRVYDNLARCPDITLGELAEVGSERRAMKTTLLVGEATPERVARAMEDLGSDR